MKIYNKKGFVAGLLWTAAGAFCLYRDAVDASDFLPQQIKSVALSLVMLAIGLICLGRCALWRCAMDYMTLKEASEKWGISARQIYYYCAAGRIPGAVKMATLWLIPKDAKKPVDGRTKQGRALKHE